MSVDVNALWQAIATAALIGTERQPLKLPALSEDLGRILTPVTPQSAESTVLQMAGVVSLYQQVGWLPTQRAIAPSPPTPEPDRPPCSSSAAECLHRILQGGFAEVLPEWLAMAAQVGQRPPELHLPVLLELGRQQRHLRTAISSVLGRRGEWLAAQNPDWSYAIAGDNEQEWETGTMTGRLLYLQQLRSHDPHQARERLMAVWGQESAGDRAKFLSTLETQLSLDDEPFLERALDDRSKDVRRVAADLLSRLPNSQLAQRMAERLTHHVTFKRAAGRIYGLEIRLPDACDAAMQRDGLNPKPPIHKGERAWWLQQIISATPLYFWEPSDAIEPTQMIQLSQLNEWKDELLEGLQLAAYRQANATWAEALLHYKQSVSPQGFNLLDVLSPMQRDVLAIALLDAHDNRIKTTPVWTLLQSLTHYSAPWSDDLSQRVLVGLTPYLAAKSSSSGYWQTRELLKGLALRIPPHLATTVAELHTTMSQSSLGDAVLNLLTTLEFRQAIAQSFHSSRGITNH